MNEWRWSGRYNKNKQTEQARLQHNIFKEENNKKRKTIQLFTAQTVVIKQYYYILKK